jgi:tRNA(Ile)-lysidine synthase
MATLCLICDWCKARGQALPAAVTVDHRLREGSAREANQVAVWAGKLGARHTTLTWEGKKPAANVHGQARDARYRLIGAWARGERIKTVVTGHTLDDQGETFLLRLARGSGLEGLGGMAPLAPFPVRGFDDLMIARPMLGFSHARLVATLEARGQEWIEDPSNAAARFDRSRLRARKRELEELGLTSERLAQTTVHLRRAMEAIDRAVAGLLTSVEVSAWGYALLPADRFGAAPREVALRALARLLTAMGGEDYPPRFDALENALAWIIEGGKAGRTLGGCRLSARDDGTILIAREDTAITRDAIELSAGQMKIWDGRFRITLTRGGPFEIKALGAKGLALAGPAVELPPVQPRLIARTSPALWTGGRLVSAPLLKFSAAEAANAHVSVEFLGLAKSKGAAKGNSL